jgi:hypothetical protein
VLILRILDTRRPPSAAPPLATRDTGLTGTQPHCANGIDEQSAIQEQIFCFAACLRDQETAMTRGAVKGSVVVRRGGVVVCTDWIA